MSRTATRFALAVVALVVLAALFWWLAWVTIRPAHAAADPNTRPMDRATCLFIERGYLAAHPERRDLHLNGNDCTVTRHVTHGAVAPPDEPKPGTITTLSYAACQGYWVSTNLNAFGYIQVGYTQLAIGACYNGSTVSRNWGPTCRIVFWPPNMRGWADYDGSYGSGTSRLTTYCQLQGELWLGPVGWCCDQYWWDQYTIDQNGNWWWS